MPKKTIAWIVWIVWLSFCLFFLSAAACGLFIFGRGFLHASIETIADIITWFWSLHWSILAPVFFVSGMYFSYLQAHRNEKSE